MLSSQTSRDGSDRAGESAGNDSCNGLADAAGQARHQRTSGPRAGGILQGRYGLVCLMGDLHADDHSAIASAMKPEAAKVTSINSAFSPKKVSNCPPKSEQGFPPTDA